MSTKHSIPLHEILSMYEQGERISEFRMRVGKKYYIYGMTNLDFYREFIERGYTRRSGSTCTPGGIVLNIPNEI